MKSLFNKIKQLVSFRRNPVVYMDPALSRAFESNTISPVATGTSVEPKKTRVRVRKVGDITISLLGKELVMSIKKEVTPRPKVRIKRPLKLKRAVKPQLLKSFAPNTFASNETVQEKSRKFTFLDAFCLGFIAILVCVLAIQNYTPGTFLTGWDTLHPEFNLPLAFTRTLLGVWRNDQGLGAIAAHSHMSELPRLVFLAVSKLFLPLSAVRYSFFFFCLLMGPVGLFLLVRTLIPSKNTQVVTLAAAVAGVSYLLNLTVLQQFYVPFEMFAVAYAAIPFLILFANKFFEKGTRKTLFIFAIMSLIAAPMAYAATLFYAWILFFGLYILSLLALSMFRATFVKRAIVLGLIVFATNAFWMIPNWYSITTQSDQIKESSINQMFTPEAYLHNVAYGDFKDVVIGKSYLFHWREYSAETHQFTELLDEWNIHMENKSVLAIFYAIAGVSLLGLVVGLFKRNTFIIASVLPFLAMLFFLMTENGPLGGLFLWVRNHVGLLDEALRNPFTKFSIPFLLLLSIYFGFGIASIIRLVKNNLMVKVARVLISLAIVGAIIYSMAPAFHGGLISPSMRVAIPTEYFQMFDWFKGHEGVRVAKFPVNSLWGWEYTNWGYQGAGFMWFGIDNPTLVRDFDRWSADNETFYLEISRALYAKDEESFRTVLQKYNVGLLVLDRSIVNAGGDDKLLFNSELEKVLSDLHYSEVGHFGFLSVYETPFGREGSAALPSFTETQTDSTYVSAVDSLTTVSSATGEVQPFLNLDERAGTKMSESNGLVITPTEFTNQSYTLSIPDIVETEKNLAVSVEVQKAKTLTILVKLIIPEISVDGKVLPIDAPYLKYEVKDQGVGFISIGDQVFDIRNKEGVVGSANIDTTKAMRLVVYSDKKTVVPSYTKEIMSKQASWCRDDSKRVVTKALNGGFGFELSDESVCLGNGFRADTSVLSSVIYETVGNITPFFCINQAGIDGCLNKTSPHVTNDFGHKSFETLAPLTRGDYWFAFVAQSALDTKQAGYQNISVGSYRAIREIPLNLKNSFAQFTSPISFEAVTGSKISVNLKASPVISENFTLKRGQPEAVNCDIEKAGSVTKNTQYDGVSYTAENDGVSCDYFDYPNLSFDHSYVMSLSGQNGEGRGLKFYLENTATHKMDVEKLAPTGSFQAFYPVLATHDKAARGYVLNLETRAFSSIESMNRITDISWYELPIEWLKGIHLTPEVATQKTSDLKVSSYKKGIVTTVTVDSTDGGVVSLNEAYEAGWVGVSDGKILKHVTVNGWENGWEVGSGNHTIYIFYWPNLLEWIGALIAVVLSVYYARTLR